ncbi:hypothetical protein P344_00520 [Spiroplasma mirum ATCC 29335]|uniref:Uncharacterized protein n=1 Tax=Spiroplasma mirum ATCC 29335 TaxID=838561 RepID=W6AJY7_9MOLU|nr:hypothetical protein P344_00520 [Spiroplasma mirum ATCC 29335]
MKALHHLHLTGAIVKEEFKLAKKRDMFPTMQCYELTMTGHQQFLIREMITRQLKNMINNLRIFLES